MNTDKIIADCADDVDLLNKRNKSIIDLSIALDRAVRQRKQLIGLAEHLAAHRPCVHYHCAACGEIVPLPPDVEVLDAGTGLTCPSCGSLTAVDLDTPEARAVRYREAERGRDFYD